MRRYIAVLVVIACVVVLLGSATRANHGRPYSVNVQHARQWLKDHTNDRAFRCAHRLWENESGWAVHAGSIHRAYGIPQAYPGTRMRAAGSDWRTDGTTQVRWGTRYVRGRYSSFCAALRYQNGHSWY